MNSVPVLASLLPLTVYVMFVPSSQLSAYLPGVFFRIQTLSPSSALCFPVPVVPGRRSHTPPPLQEQGGQSLSRGARRCSPSTATLRLRVWTGTARSS